VVNKQLRRQREPLLQTEILHWPQELAAPANANNQPWTVGAALVFCTRMELAEVHC